MGSINCKRKKKETTSVSSLSIKQRREEDNSTNQTSPPPFSSHVHSERRVVEDGVVMKTNQASNDSDSSRQSSESSDQNGNESDEESSSGSASSCDEGGVSDHEQDKLNITLDDKVKEVLKGRLNFEMPEKVKIVRIFTSSTFTDTSVERNTLMVRVYPRIKKFCQERGYDFQVVDMRWGVRDESTDDHLTSELCMKELRACQRLSTGPNFITFLGQKYGYRPFPPKVPAVEFEKLFGAVDNNDDKNLLQRWFRRDDNSIPPQYLLQPISSVLPDYRNCGNSESRKKASSMWWTAFERMQIILRKSAEKVLNSEDRLKYFISVTEDEIYGGIITSPSPANNCLWFKRYISNLNESVESPKAGKFIDKMLVGTAETIDKEAQRHLKNLREKLSYVLPKTSIKLYDVKWNENGIDTNSSPEHARYITDLCETFFTTVTGMIENAVSERSAVEIEEPLTDEVIGHLSFCLKKCKAFHGREMFLKNVKETLKRDQHTIVIHGESGCGKTAIMAKVCTEVRQWFNQDDVIVVVRFIGTSPDSSNIRSLLRSICLQLCKLSGEDPREVPQEMKALVEYFPECLESATDSSHVVIVLDSLDQLSPDYGARQMDWLPKTLPKNVYLLLSTLPGEEYQCLTILKAKLPDECLKEVPKIPLTEADTILSKWLESASRSLTHIQSGLVMKAFQQCQLPIFLKLAFDEAIRWKSYSDDASTFLGSSVRFMINALLDRVERIHGNVLVGHALGYITASKNGLTETELEDLLSLDDDVLNDVYQYWTPPIRRLPPLLWIRIRSDIKDYLIDRGADGTRVIYWYHRQFIEVARERYLAGEEAKKIHAKMSEYFLGTWADGRKKPFTDKKGNMSSEDRLLSAQPLMFDSVEPNPIFNLRMLSELPQHLIFSKQLNKLKEKVLCNFSFLLTKIRAYSVDVVLEDFVIALSVFPDDSELDMLEKTLRLCAVALRTDYRQLATQLIGRLFQFSKKSDNYPNISSLIKQAYSSPVVCLIPSQKCLSAPGGSLIASLEINEDALHCCAFSCDEETAYYGSTTCDGLQIQVLQLQTGKIQKKINLTDPFEMAYTWSMKGSDKNKDVLFIMGSKYIFMINTQTGALLQRFRALQEEIRYEPMPPVSFADDEKRVVAITDRDLRIWTVADGILQHSIPVGKIDTNEQYGTVDAYQNLVVFCLRESKVITILDVITGKLIREVEVFAQTQDSLVREVKIASGENVLTVSSSLKSLRMFNLRSGTLSKEIRGFSINPGLHRLQLTKDRRKAVSIVQYEVMVTDLESGEIFQTLKSKSFGTLVIHTDLFTRDGRFVLSIGNDNILRIYDIKRSREEDKQQNVILKNVAVASSDVITGLFPGVDGRHIIASATVQMSSELSVWDSESGVKVRALKCTSTMLPQELCMCSPTRGVGFIHDVNLFHFKVFDFKEGRIERCLIGKASKRTKAFGCINQNHVIGFSRGRRNLKVWNIDTGKVTQQYIFGQKHRFEEMFVSLNGQMVVCAQVSNAVEHSEEKTLPIVALNTTTGQHKFLEIQKKKLCLTFSALSDDGTYLICLTNDLKPRLWNLKTGKLLHKLEDKEFPVAYATAISVQRQLALTAQSDGNINAWKIESGRLLYTFICETVDVILLSEDGNVAYSRYRYRNRNIDAWDLRNGTKLATFTSDWKPERISIVGNVLVLGKAETPEIITLKVHIPGSQESNDRSKQITSMFHDAVSMEKNMYPCSDSPSPEDGDNDLDDDQDKTDFQKSEFTRKALLAKPNVIIGGGSLVDSKNVFISESVFKQNFQ